MIRRKSQEEFGDPDSVTEIATSPLTQQPDAPTDKATAPHKDLAKRRLEKLKGKDKGVNFGSSKDNSEDSASDNAADALYAEAFMRQVSDVPSAHGRTYSMRQESGTSGASGGSHPRPKHNQARRPSTSSTSSAPGDRAPLSPIHEVVPKPLPEAKLRQQRAQQIASMRELERRAASHENAAAENGPAMMVRGLSPHSTVSDILSAQRDQNQQRTASKAALASHNRNEVPYSTSNSHPSGSPSSRTLFDLNVLSESLADLRNSFDRVAVAIYEVLEGRREYINPDTESIHHFPNNGELPPQFCEPISELPSLSNGDEKLVPQANFEGVKVQVMKAKQVKSSFAQQLRAAPPNPNDIDTQTFGEVSL